MAATTKSHTFSTAIKSHGTIDTTARETYGSGHTLLRIGNGGAGATGLIRALAEDYLATRALSNNNSNNSTPKSDSVLDLSSSDPTSSSELNTGSIEWICNHSRNTQLALLHGHIDIALTYERDQEALAESEGWSRTVGCAFHDHFCLAGPVSDPGRIFSASTVEDAFRRIAKGKSLFYARADMSATMWKERSLWSRVGLKPWELSAPSETQTGEGDLLDGDNKEWYVMNQLSPADALIKADQDGAYLVTDRATLLSLVRTQQIHTTTIFFEPDAPDHVLMNSCFELVATVSQEMSKEEGETEKKRTVKEFLEYLLSKRGQDIVAEFGRSSGDEFTLFARVEDGFARTFLRGGRPKDGCWIVQTMRKG